MPTRHKVCGSLLAALPCLFACTSAMAFEDARPPASGTTLEVSKGYEVGAGFGHASGQYYYVGPGSDCLEWKRAGFFTWLTGESKTLPIEPDRPMTVFSEVSRSTSGVGLVYLSNCWGASTFIPMPGHHYRARFIAPRAGRCYMQMEDGETNTPVSVPLRLGHGFCQPPKGSLAASFQRHNGESDETGDHSRDLYPPSTRVSAPPAPPAPTPSMGASPQPWQVASPAPPQTVTASSPAPGQSAPWQSWAPGKLTWPPARGDARRVVEIRVNADGSVTETRDH